MQQHPHFDSTRIFPNFIVMKHRLVLLGILTLFFAGPVAAQLVINEVDYDQASTDTAEFV